MAITHLKVSAKSDPADTSLIRPSDWNSSHAIDSATIGTGDALNFYTATTAQLFGVRKGTAAAGDTTLHPLVKFERTIGAVTEASIAGDGVEQLAAIVGQTNGIATTEVQMVGVAGFAETPSTVSFPGNDACGGYFGGEALASATGSGIGVFAIGRRTDATGRATGIEIHVRNGSATDGTYDSSGASSLTGIWLNAGGSGDSGVGMAISNTEGVQFRVGIAFTAQVNGGLTGGVADASIRDDSQSATSLDIRGTHSLYGLDLHNGAYTVAQVRLKNNSLIVARNAANTLDHSVMYYNSSNWVVLGEGAVRVYSGQDFMIGGGKNYVFDTATGSKLGVATNNKIGFWNATPVVQPTGIINADGTLADITTKFNTLITTLETIGLLATV